MSYLLPDKQVSYHHLINEFFHEVAKGLGCFLWYPFISMCVCIQLENGEKITWRSYFDYVIVDAKKPLFFEEGSMLREVDKETNSLRLGVFTGPMQQGKVFSGGEWFVVACL